MKEQELQIVMVYDHLITWFIEEPNKEFHNKIQRNIVPLLYKLDSIDNVLQFEKEYAKTKKGNVKIIAFSYIAARPQGILNGKLLTDKKEGS